MDKKGFALLIALIFVLMLNSVMASDVDNITNTIDDGNDATPILSTTLKEDTLSDANSQLEDTKISGGDDVVLDGIGEYYQIKLLDSDNKTIKDAPITFHIVGKDYKTKTNNNGIASLQINLADGIYNITTTYAGNDMYKGSSKLSTITVNNTRYVEAGLTGAEIQKIIDNAKPNNVIVFLGSSYNNVNLEITKSLTLISNGNTQLKSSSSKPVISIKGQASSLTTIKGFKIDSGGNGIEIENANYVEIYNNEIKSKGYGIRAESAKYLNITKNKVKENSKDGIVIALSENTYIISNDISKNGGNGVALGASKNIYMYYNTINENGGDGILMDTEVGFVEYGSGPQNVFIDSNTINKNKGDAVEIKRAGNNINITTNTINNNKGNGIAVYKIGNNNIRANVINSNGESGIRFKEAYVRPKEQFIGHNVIMGNNFREIDARETYYDEGKFRLVIEDNWYGDSPNLCPKIKSANIQFNIKQYSSYYFNVTFTDSEGNIVSDLPSRAASVRVGNGRTKYFTVNGGTTTFEIDASDGSIVKVTVDDATRTATYKYSDPNYVDIYVPPYDSRVRPISEVGQPYPGIPRPGLYPVEIPGNNTGDENQNGETPNSDNSGSGEGDGNGEGTGDGNGNGEGTGEGNGNGASGGENTQGNGTSKQESTFTGNSTTTQNADPSNSAAEPVASTPTTATTPTTTTSTSAPTSESVSSNPSESGSDAPTQSVVKQIKIEEEDIVKISGISLIILLMLLTIAFYYRDDIKEMRAKM